jgi:hypothetical protein
MMRNKRILEQGLREIKELRARIEINKRIESKD